MNEHEAKIFLLSNGIFYESLQCPKCGAEMSKDINRWAFRCQLRTCRIERSLSSHTFFAGSLLKMNQILYLGRLWLLHVTVTSAISLTGHSPKIVTKFWKHFRQLVASTLDFEDQVIGGKGIVVDVDETKLGKRKYHRGHRVNGVWAVVGVERTPSRKVFIVSVVSRDFETLKEIVKAHVLPESIINTDMWKEYSWIDSDDNYLHNIVNYSTCFKNAKSGVHTNFVEGTNSALKRKIPVRNRVSDGITEHLGEFIWRRKHDKEDLWNCFLAALKEVHYDFK